MIAVGNVCDLPVPVSLLASRETHLDGLVEWCRSALDRGDLKTALAVSDRAIRLAGKNRHICLLRGTVLLTAGKPAAALDQFAVAQSLGASPDAEVGLIHTYLALSDFEAADENLKRLLRQYSVVDFPIVASLAGHVCRTGKAKMKGWASRTPAGELFFAVDRESYAADSAVLICDETSGEVLLDVATTALPPYETPRDGLVLIRVDLSPRSAASAVSVSVGGEALLGSPALAAAPSEIEGVVERVGSRIRGWLRYHGHPSIPLGVRLSGAGKVVNIGTTGTPDWDEASDGEPGTKRQYFSIAAEATQLDGALAEVWGWNSASGEGNRLTGSPVDCTVGCLQPQRPRIATGRLSRYRGDRPIDVIVPVYRGIEETTRCLESVLAARRANRPGMPDIGIVVIDDATPDRDIRAYLDVLADAGEIERLSNDRNLGFPLSVNRGIALHPERDVVVLNSDTVVFDGWLERLRAATYAAPDIGTATPLSNNATILSYPRFLEDNPMPSVDQGRALDFSAGQVNAGLAVDIPTAVGFCMYIRRDCLDSVGPLNVAAFGRGYGEENDFCMRASAAGWRHVAVTDVFVMHTGGSSFGAAKNRLIARNTAILNRLHPEYAKRVDRFIRSDPIAAARRSLDLARLRHAGATETVLLVSMSLPGGVARHVADRVTHFRSQGRRVLMIEPDDSAEPGERCRLADPADDTLCNLLFAMPDELDGLEALLREQCVVHVELHHFLGLDPKILGIANRLGVSYDVFLHDYSWICPRITLMRGNGTYCGAPADTRICDRCIRSSGTALHEPISTRDLRRRSAAVLEAAASVVAPCDDVRGRYTNFVPGVAYKVRPWEKPIDFTPTARPSGRTALRIVVIGAIGLQKGYDILMRCARDAAKRDLPIEFVIVGFTEDDFSLFDTGRVFVTGRYDEAEALALIAEQDADFVFLPSVSPETWSYALTLAWKAGLEVFAFDLGAVAERIRASGHGRVMPFSANPMVVNDALLSFAAERAAPGSSQQARQPRRMEAELTVHVRNRGDLRFQTPSWAGCVGQGLWIEGFAIGPLGDLSPDDIEYKALLGNGVETPWTSGGVLCGTRGASMPLVAFAIRLRGAAALRFDCVYRGSFFAGGTGHMVAAGAPCMGATMTDPLDGIYVEIFEKSEAAP